MPKHEGGIRWSLRNAATDFGVVRETLTRLLKQGDHSPGDDGQYSTRQIHSALAGDLKAERIKLTRELTREKEIKNKESEGLLISATDAADVACRFVFAARQVVMLWKISAEQKNDYLAELRGLAEIDWKNLSGYDAEAPADE